MLKKVLIITRLPPTLKVTPYKVKVTGRAGQTRVDLNITRLQYLRSR